MQKAEVDITKRAGELTKDEIAKIRTIIQNPREFHIPDWFLNRNKDMRSGGCLHLVSNQIAQKYREDMERMKKMRMHRGLRHLWLLKVRGQHTKTTGRRGRTVGMAKKERVCDLLIMSDLFIDTFM
eukprot:TRINITY_DN12485_c0_g1_i1.p1 TRINITY_DN12485_c0_g1~~TRINITY_DN12485_c0_g1_i1.p1  ORF type:complete len:126 (-),score=29.02 TRINITY_DN12485_c0_g1_i1:75-452(-)